LVEPEKEKNLMLQPMCAVLKTRHIKPTIIYWEYILDLDRYRIYVIPVKRIMMPLKIYR